jgi:DNA repair exonuclease SbcCD ATPase subunit
MFFGQSNDLNFLDCNADDKRTVIRNFLNVGDLFDMRDKIKAIKSEHWQGMKSLDAVVEETQRQITLLSTKVAAIEEAKQGFSEFSGIPEGLTLEQVLDIERHNAHIHKQKTSLTNELEVAHSRHSKMKSKMEEGVLEFECPECGQQTPYDIPASKRSMDAVWAGIETKTTQLKFMVSKREVVISSSKFSKYLKYRDLCNNSTNYLELKEDMLKIISEKQEQKDKHKLDYEVMRFWEKAFSEQGIIKYIIKNVLGYFNERCNYYLSYLTNTNYSIQFDEELGEKIETDGRLVAYISLSGGEKRKINLAVTLGLKDLLLLTDKSHADLIFFDEITEGIDAEGVQGLYNLLLEIKKTKTVFIITHNKHLKTLLDSSRRVTIIKDKGTSTILKENNGKSNFK